MLAIVTLNASTLLLLTLLAAASWTDITRQRVPNWLSLGGCALALAMQAWFLGAEGLLAALGGIGVALALFLPFYLLRSMGAGDVKLMMAVGAFLGSRNTLLAGGLTLFAGALAGLGLLFVRNGMRAAAARYASMFKFLWVTGHLSYEPPHSGEAAASRFPYALAITAGTLATLWWLAELEQIRSMLAYFLYG